MEIVSVNNIKKDCKTVIKSVRNHHVTHAVFKGEQQERYGNKAISLKLPPKTRWFYFVISMHTLKANKAALQSTVIDEQSDVEKDVRSTVLSDDIFWDPLNELYSLLLPIAKAITILEKDRTVLSEVPVLIKKIQMLVISKMQESSFLSDEEKQTINNAVTTRLYYCASDVHFAANLLDPRRRGIDLDTVEKSAALDFINKQCTYLQLDKRVVMANLAEFRTKTNFYATKSIWDVVTEVAPAVWWGGFCADQALYPIAI